MNINEHARKNRAVMVWRSFEQLAEQAGSISEFMAIELGKVQDIEGGPVIDDKQLELEFLGFELTLQLALESLNGYCQAAGIPLEPILLKDGERGEKY